MKKKYCEKTNNPLDSSSKIFSFKGILVVSLCFLIVYYFLIFNQIPNCLSANIIMMKKNIMKITKMPIEASFNYYYFCFQMYFNRFTVQLKWKKNTYFFLVNLVMTNGFCENISMPLIAEVKFFGWSSKIIIILFKWTMFF